MTKHSERPIEHRGVYYWPSRRGAEQAIDDMMIRRQYPHARVVEYTRGYAVQLFTSGPYIPLSGDEHHTFAGYGDVLDNPGAKMPQAFTYNDAAEIYDNMPRGKLGANTTIRREDNGDFVIRLYGTDILTYHPDDTITINTGGYRTVTTKARINAFLSPKAELYAKRGKWYIRSGSGVYPFEDGATLTAARGGVRENPRLSKDRHDAMYPKYQMAEWEYDHLRNWLASGRAPISSDISDDATEVKRLASRIQAFLESMSKEDAVYAVEQGWSHVLRYFEAQQ